MYINKNERNRRAQAERREAMRRALLVRRGSCLPRGYHGTAAGGGDVRRAGVTHGAMYHHFEGKRNPFQAVVEEVEAGSTS